MSTNRSACAGVSLTALEIAEVVDEAVGTLDDVAPGFGDEIALEEDDVVGDGLATGDASFVDCPLWIEASTAPGTAPPPPLHALRASASKASVGRSERRCKVPIQSNELKTGWSIGFSSLTDKRKTRARTHNCIRRSRDAVPIIVSNDFPPQSGGIQRVMSQIALGIAARARDVVVVAPKNVRSVAFDRSVPYRVVRYAVTGRRFVDVLAMIPTYLGALRSSRDKATIASIWWPSAVAVSLVPKALRGRLVVFAHGSEIAPGRTGIRRFVMRFVYRSADVVLANSTLTESLLAMVGTTSNVRRVSMAVDSRPIAPSPSPIPTILSVGRLIERKGFDRTIEALAILTSEFPQLRYVIVGAGPQEDALVALAHRFGVAERVLFRGQISDDELGNAYAEAWIFALPTRLVDDDVEGFGLVYLEAAMAHLPSIGGIGSGAVDAIVDGETGLLVDGNDARAIAAAVRRLLEDREVMSTMGRRAFERALTFTWDRTVTEVLAALSQ